jgi:hypothetical protein
VPAPVGHVDVTLTNSGGAGYAINAAASTCDDAGDNLDANGQCTITFTSPTAGTVKGHAVVSLVVGGVTLSRNTDGNAPNSGDATKIFVAGSIKWTKVDNAGALQGGATFTVCKTASYTLPSGPFVDIVPADCFDVLDNSTADADKTDGKFELVGLALGRYTVHEKTAPAGFIPDPKTETVELIPGSVDATISSAFVNSRPILKISGFGYTNVATGTPTHGVTSGTTVFTFDLHNYGGANAVLTNSSLAVSVTGGGGGTLVCGALSGPPFTKTISGTIVPGGDLGSNSLSCTYSDMPDGAVISATLVVKYTTNGLEREASGSPATISFTVQAD